MLERSWQFLSDLEKEEIIFSAADGIEMTRKKEYALLPRPPLFAASG